MIGMIKGRFHYDWKTGRMKDTQSKSQATKDMRILETIIKMTENKRYFSIDYDEEYYIFDSTKISKEEVLEKAEYSYDVFGDSLMGNEVLDLLNENEQLKQQVEDLYESDKSLRKFASNMTLNYTGICVPQRLFVEVITILKDIEHNDLVEDLSKESIDTSANGC